MTLVLSSLLFIMYVLGTVQAHNYYSLVRKFLNSKDLDFSKTGFWMHVLGWPIIVLIWLASSYGKDEDEEEDDSK